MVVVVTASGCCRLPDSSTQHLLACCGLGSAPCCVAGPQQLRAGNILTREDPPGVSFSVFLAFSRSVLSRCSEGAYAGCRGLVRMRIVSEKRPPRVYDLVCTGCRRITSTSSQVRN